ncbi:porin family protein [Taibaiella sp. KBW10]|uniref:porin family protein n=1 Tax=Taibaiella sp. KBW10 TaxID=2153357 RepID=UPI00131572C5|nr:porin family protein [Taibaiella sp. KBW10]
MKKSLLFLAILSGLAAHTYAQVTVTPEFGFLTTKFSAYTTDNGMRNSLNYDWQIGPRGGIAFDIPIGSKGFSVEPGLFYNSKMIRVVDENSMMRSDLKMSMSNAELPINLKYSWSIREYTGKLFVFATPYVSYSFSGRRTGDITVKQPTVSIKQIDDKINFKSGATQELKPLDYGAYVGFGYQFQMGFQLKMTYGVGMSNLSVVPGASLKSSSMFGLSAGFVLGRKIAGRFY